MAIKFRQANESDISVMQKFIFIHGPNPWNFLPEKAVKDHIAEIATGNVFAFIAEQNKQCIGFACAYFDVPANCKKYLDNPKEKIAYLSEIVVHREHAGQGVGSGLIHALADFLKAHHVKYIYTERHADNPGSAGVMLKTGFKIIDEFHDPERRPNGSQKTTVLRLEL